MTQLSVRPTTQPAVQPVPAQSALVKSAWARIIPYEVIDLMDRRIYQFVKLGGKEQGVRAAFNDPKVPRQLATVCIIRGAKTFQLCYYPWQDQPQIMEEVPLEQLEQVAADLLAVGFGGEKDFKPL